MAEPRVYSVADFCVAYGIGRTKVYEEINAGYLTVCKVGDRTIIEPGEGQRWLASKRVNKGVPVPPSSPAPQRRRLTRR
jgi:hypothetical protein